MGLGVVGQNGLVCVLAIHRGSVLGLGLRAFWGLECWVRICSTCRHVLRSSYSLVSGAVIIGIRFTIIRNPPKQYR